MVKRTISHIPIDNIGKALTPKKDPEQVLTTRQKRRIAAKRAKRRRRK
jgi:hypothetical protein